MQSRIIIEGYNRMNRLILITSVLLYASFALWITGCALDAHLGLTPVSSFTSSHTEYRPKAMHLKCIWGSCDDVTQGS